MVAKMANKLIARILEVATSPVSGKEYVTTVGGTLETINLDGRWGTDRIYIEMQDAIHKRIKTGILKQNVGYAVYFCGSGGLRLKSIHLQSAFAKYPQQFL